MFPRCALAKKTRWAALGLALCLTDAPADAQQDELDFFAEEALVVSVSRRPQPLHRSPATVYVVTREEILASGALTLWDALRAVPGVDVVQVGTAQGEVSIRGLGRSLSNRTLVLLDGKSVLSGLDDKTTWESIPVGIEEIDRIEVVEGPVSALYGANAINGVINLITRTPEQLAGGAVRLGVGEYATQLHNMLYGFRAGALSGKLSLGRRRTNRFEKSDHRASAVDKAHAYLAYRFGQTPTLFELRGGLNNVDSRLNIGSLGVIEEIGPSGFLRADATRGDTRLRAFWDRNRTRLREEEDLVDEPGMKRNVYELAVEHAFPLPNRHSLVAGADYRHARANYPLLRPGPQTRDLTGLFFEYQWRPQLAWTLVGSGRLDHHSIAGWQLSPRFSALYSPAPRHALRFSAGTAYRFANFTESELDLNRPIIIGDDELVIDVVASGKHDLEPEHMQMLEAVYSGHFDGWHLSAAAFRYWLENAIAIGVPEILLGPEGLGLRVNTAYDNLPGRTRAWGGELGVRAEWTPDLTLSANYAYLDLSGALDPMTPANGGPRHKVNVGGRFKRGGLTASGWLHWVGQTEWYSTLLRGGADPLGTVDAYALVNAHLGYTFQHRLRGLTLALNAFNLTDHRHVQILPEEDTFTPGQKGEIIRRRLVLTVSCPL